ncbi:hypothetical protein MGYG_07097 [Nannizzia gypsea CBS 118893]|uniref:Uncharacterized protein n=1 Tax=Arthroderma gypseum (strain ATCC MYA-4604 / CBS 118893) TaxID=535722 RepID=E4V225_ARTGP|nr:hypothetical protein MGYG_07097 [Nannizzia gypsea CBS 118893]EFR04090.1 hypothetical protein MGYG_07097 [Nannizzia gypsea CBS 118893]
MASMYFQDTSTRVWDYLDKMDADWVHEPSIISDNNFNSGELTWGAQLSHYPKQKPASTRHHSLKRDPSDASNGYRREFLSRRDRSASGSSFSSTSTSSRLSCNMSSHEGSADLNSVIQNLSSQLGFDLNETFNCAKQYSKPVKSPKTMSSSARVVAPPNIKSTKTPNVRHEFAFQIPYAHKPATTVEYDSMMSALNTPIKATNAPASVDAIYKTDHKNAGAKEVGIKKIKSARKVSFAEVVQELPIVAEVETEPEQEPEMIIDGGSDSESDGDSVPEAVFLNVSTSMQGAPRVRHVEIRDAEEEESDYIKVYHS